MQFYRFEGINKNYDSNNDSDREDQRLFSRTIERKTAQFNKNNPDAFFFFADAESELVTIGAMMFDTRNYEGLFYKFINELDYCLDDVSFDEITFKDMRNLLSQADRMDYIFDDDQILEKYELDVIGSWHGFSYGENLIDEMNRDECYAAAERYLVRKELSEELDRIFAGEVRKKVPGHPVHYFVETDDCDVRKKIYRVLLSALFLKQRISSRRYCFLDITQGMSFERLDQLYKSCIGGTVIVRTASNNYDEEDYANPDRDSIELVCKVMQKYKNQVLTIFCLPRECHNLKPDYYEHLGCSTFVEIKENLVSEESAISYLKMLARERGLRFDKNLAGALKYADSYLASELNSIFELWCEEKLRKNIFPQYKNLNIAKEYLVKEKPKGTAYDELMQMIGLDSAKKVINNALNYYKAQKVFADQISNDDRPAMHMIFTGNPGTAKTTVARLFSKIMRENNIVSKGHLVEVGRGDLVGKFVGWTAPTIKKKFAEAKGGVLFIDEAYSLVDDRDGSFGDEAINTIVQEMENHREDVVVIFAGYPDKMEKFLNKNPGLRSRIAFHINFDDYDTKALCDIASLIAEQKGMKLANETHERLEAIFDEARKQSDFGNGRFARNLIEKARMTQANRLMSMDIDKLSTEDVITICADDLEMPQINKHNNRRAIGFLA